MTLGGAAAAGLRTEPPFADDPERRPTLRRADQARSDYAASIDELTSQPISCNNL